jgi:hypothetical protein
MQFAGGMLLLGLVGDMGSVVPSVTTAGWGSWLGLVAGVLLAFHFIIAALAFGIHIDSVGSWVPRRARSLRLVHGSLKLAKAASASPVSNDHFVSVRSK